MNEKLKAKCKELMQKHDVLYDRRSSFMRGFLAGVKEQRKEDEKEVKKLIKTSRFQQIEQRLKILNKNKWEISNNGIFKGCTKIVSNGSFICEAKSRVIGFFFHAPKDIEFLISALQKRKERNE